MTDLIDLHTHTLASGHAYNTLMEMIRAAADKGLALYGCADHAPSMPGTLPESVLARLDYAIASIHPPCYSGKTISENTSAYLGVLKNPYIQIIGHPDDGRFPVDYDTLAAAAAEHHKLLEVNNSSLHPHGFRPNARENYQVLLEYCRKYKTHIIINSDAHICFDIGNHDFAHEMLAELDFPEELIVNTSLEKLDPFIPVI